MASPAGYEEQKKDTTKKILFRFCSECSNLLFPREDKANNKLLFACRTCSFAEEAPSSCVMRHEIASSVGDTAGITQDVGQDPTVGLSQSFANATLSEEELYDDGPSMCTMCGEEILCLDCGEESAPGICFEADDPDAMAGVSQQEADEQDSKN